MDTKTILLIKCKLEKDYTSLLIMKNITALDEKIYNFSTEGHE